jgi:hypothetical protein
MPKSIITSLLSFLCLIWQHPLEIWDWEQSASWLLTLTLTNWYCSVAL